MAKANSTRSLVPVHGTKQPIKSLEPNPNGGFTAFDCIKAAEEIAVHWWTILNEAHVQGDFPKSYLGPDAGKHTDIEELSRWLSLAKSLFAMSQGKPCKYKYEIWTSRGHRLEGGYEYQIEAEQEKEKWLSKYPDAFVVRSHVHPPVYGNDNIELLDTLIGQIRWSGSFLVNNDEMCACDIITLQDETGRCVDVRSDMLVDHPVWHRLSHSAQERILFDVEKAKMRASRKEGEVHHDD